MSSGVSFELPSPALAVHRWRLACPDDAESHPPLIAELYATIQGDGVVAVGGYLYARDDAQGRARTAGEGTGPLDRLYVEWLPRVEALAASLDGVEPAQLGTETFAEHVDEWSDVAAGVQNEVLQPAARAAAAFVEAFTTHFGEGRDDDARTLIEAIPSRASRRAAVVWEMSRLVRSQGSRLSRTFGPTGGQRDYMQLRERVQQEFPFRVPGYRQDVPAWGEDHSTITRAVRAASGLRDEASPIAAQQQRLHQRSTVQAELARAAMLPGVADLMELLPKAQEQGLAVDALAEPVGRLIASARSMWLRAGADLESRGALADGRDVFYLARSELVAALDAGSGPASGEIERRRAEHAAFEAATPPSTLGMGAAG